MKSKKIDIHVEDCGGRERTFDALVTKAMKRGEDKVGEAIVGLKFHLALRHGRMSSLEKFYFGPFTKNSALLRDLKRILGPTVAESAVFDLNLAVNKACRVKVTHGESHARVHVLDRNEEKR